MIWGGDQGWPEENNGKESGIFFVLDGFLNFVNHYAVRIKYLVRGVFIKRRFRLQEPFVLKFYI